MAPPPPPRIIARHHHHLHRTSQHATTTTSARGITKTTPECAAMPSPASRRTEQTPGARGTRSRPSPDPPHSRNSGHPQPCRGGRRPALEPPPRSKRILQEDHISAATGGSHSRLPTLPTQLWLHRPSIRIPPPRMAPRGTAARQLEASSWSKEASPPPPSAGRASLTGFLRWRREKQVDCGGGRGRRLGFTQAVPLEAARANVFFPVTNKNNCYKTENGVPRRSHPFVVP